MNRNESKNKLRLNKLKCEVVRTQKNSNVKESLVMPNSRKSKIQNNWNERSPDRRRKNSQLTPTRRKLMSGNFVKKKTQLVKTKQKKTLQPVKNVKTFRKSFTDIQKTTQQKTP